MSNSLNTINSASLSSTVFPSSSSAPNPNTKVFVGFSTYDTDTTGESEGGRVCGLRMKPGRDPLTLAALQARFCIRAACRCQRTCILTLYKLFVIQDYYIETRQDYREIPSNPFGLYLISCQPGTGLWLSVEGAMGRSSVGAIYF